MVYVVGRVFGSEGGRKVTSGHMVIKGTVGSILIGKLKGER